MNAELIKGIVICLAEVIGVIIGGTLFTNLIVWLARRETKRGHR